MFPTERRGGDTDTHWTGSGVVSVKESLNKGHEIFESWRIDSKTLAKLEA